MKRVRIAELKSHLSEHLRAVKRGETIEILERDSPIARITALESGSSHLRVRPRAERTVPLAATAHLWREHSGESLVMATHDAALALAARATDMTVIGC